MTRIVVVRERNAHSRTKVKTGCVTCRIRRVKCDENKPACQKCVSTGRTCDGYKSPFRIRTSQAINNAHTSSIDDVAMNKITPQEIDLLSRCFSTKTIFNVKLGCDEEARQVLRASLTDLPIRHAISSLRALRENFETSDRKSASAMQQTLSYNYGLQQYSMALEGLASNLSSPGSKELRSALLCCQIFISIEQVQQNYAAMAQHIVRGLRIMHEYQARPHLNIAKELVPASHDQLPLLDVFLIKLFAAPCKFAEPPAAVDPYGTASSVSPSSHSEEDAETCNLRILAPDIRTELTRIAASSLRFLDQGSKVESIGDALRLLSKKTALLESLDSWLIDFDRIQMENKPAKPESISASFMRIFYTILRIVLLGALNRSPDLDIELRTESDRLQAIADSVGERLRTYRICSGTSNGRR